MSDQTNVDELRELYDHAINCAQRGLSWSQAAKDQGMTAAKYQRRVLQACGDLGEVPPVMKTRTGGVRGYIKVGKGGRLILSGQYATEAGFVEDQRLDVIRHPDKLVIVPLQEDESDAGGDDVVE